MSARQENRFEDFFADESYVSLKNHLYNYLLRRRAIARQLKSDRVGRILEVGSGLSPMLDPSERIVYSELSFPALRLLKKRQKLGAYAVADAIRLPFASGAFSHVICSEVVEHLPDDQAALNEMARVMANGGSLILTFPHRRSYFALDDRFVNHFRRYELADMEAKLSAAGLRIVEVKKVLGPLEKATMWSVVLGVSLLKSAGKPQAAQHPQKPTGRLTAGAFRLFNLLYALPVRLDALLAPRRFSAVLLVRATHRKPAQP
jgi:SAM-dependent methyltransferase